MYHSGTKFLFPMAGLFWEKRLRHRCRKYLTFQSVSLSYCVCIIYLVIPVFEINPPPEILLVNHYEQWGIIEKQGKMLGLLSE